MSTHTVALTAAAEAALRAPSIFNTQPWRWHVTSGGLDLYADPGRQLPVVDPDHRLSTLSCGVALHHARTALAAEGYDVEVVRLPDAQRPNLLARLRISGHHPPAPEDIRRYETTLIRHTDRRLFTDQPVPSGATDSLRDAAEAERTHLHVLRRDDVPVLASAVAHAQAMELADPAYRAELAHWTGRTAGARDGVPAATVTAPAPRTVRVREFTLDGSGRSAAGSGTDNRAVYAVLSADADEPRTWLRAGEALSAVLLTAVVLDLAVSPMSDVAEVPATRALLRGLLAGIGYPLLVLRVGVAEPNVPVAATPRRSAADAVRVDP